MCASRSTGSPSIDIVLGRSSIWCTSMTASCSGTPTCCAARPTPFAAAIVSSMSAASCRSSSSTWVIAAPRWRSTGRHTSRFRRTIKRGRLGRTPGERRARRTRRSMGPARRGVVTHLRPSVNAERFPFTPASLRISRTRMIVPNGRFFVCVQGERGRVACRCITSRMAALSSSNSTRFASRKSSSFSETESTTGASRFFGDDRAFRFRQLDRHVRAALL